MASRCITGTDRKAISPLLRAVTVRKRGFCRSAETSGRTMVHELSLAHSLVEILVEQFRERPNVRITTVYLRLGPLAGVVESALKAAFAVAALGTLAEGACLRIEHAPAVVRCRSCGQEQSFPTNAETDHDILLSSLVTLPTVCPACGALSLDLVHGDELELVAAEVVDG